MKKFFKGLDCQSLGKIHHVRLYTGQSDLLEKFEQDAPKAFQDMLKQIATAIEARQFASTYGISVSFAVESFSDSAQKRIMEINDSGLFKTERIDIQAANMQPEYDNDIGILNSIMITVVTSKF